MNILNLSSEITFYAIDCAIVDKIEPLAQKNF